MTEIGNRLQTATGELLIPDRGLNTPSALESSKTSCSSIVFQNEDIVELILSFFDPEAFWGDGIWDIDLSTRKALFSACLTARSFVAPASGLLWRMMTSLIPIFSIIPTFTKGSVSDVYTINGSILPIHLDRLKTYSCKVRYLYLQSFQDSFASHFITRLVSEQNFTLFPALKTLYIPSLSPSGFQFRGIDNLTPLFLIHGLSLTTLILGGINSSTDVFTASLLSALSQRAIAVQDLILSGRLPLEILSCIPNFSRLQGLNVTFEPGSVVASAFIHYCSNLPDLTHLIINLSHATMESANPPAGNNILDFPCIQELRLTGDPAETSKILCLLNRTPSLKTVKLAQCATSLQVPANASSAIESCIQCLATIAPTLQVLEVNMGTGKIVVLPENVLRPLIQCTDLVCLEIFGVSLPITDDHIGELCAGDNWHNLETLSLPLSVDGKSPSLSSLQMLAQSCPTLLNLTLPVDFRLHTPPTLHIQRQQLPRGSNVIERLSIHKITTTWYANDTNTVEMGIAVSRFIEYCLPRLKETRLHSDSPMSDVEWWRTVKTMIAEFRNVRHEAVYGSSTSPS